MATELVALRDDPTGWARALGISTAAVELYVESDVIDLHLDSFLWTRILGYDLRRRHRGGLLGHRFYSQVDFPRAAESLTGATWVITTNPFRTGASRERAFFRNYDRIVSLVRAEPTLALVRTAAEYRAARAAGRHGVWIGVQGGNAFDHDLDAVDRVPPLGLLRVTLLHLTPSKLGATSVPGWPRPTPGLTARGKELVARLNAARILVDLAHISRQGFFDALDVQDPSQPVVVTHTGVDAVRPHWRNVTDRMIRAVADRGGLVGIMFQSPFLGRGPVSATTVIDHAAHVIARVGEDFVSIGSDYDGAITPPRDLPTPAALPRLVEDMLQRGWSDTRIRKILGGNALRVIAAQRG